MDSTATTVVTALVTFAITNIDDVFVLMLFFSQPAFRSRHVVLGQYLGFSALVAISLLGFVASLIIPRPWIGVLGLAPILIGVQRLIQQGNEPPHSEQPPRRTGAAALAALAGPDKEPGAHTVSVAAVTFANGGDNIGIYTPLFASSTFPQLVIVLTVFFLLVGVWCYAGLRISRHPPVARALARYGPRLVPFVLISLGIYILVESGTFTLLGF